MPSSEDDLLPDQIPISDGMRPISYNPFEADTFILRDNANRPPVKRADLVILDGRRAHALNPSV